MRRGTQAREARQRRAALRPAALRRWFDQGITEAQMTAPRSALAWSNTGDGHPELHAPPTICSGPARWMCGLGFGCLSVDEPGNYHEDLRGPRP